MSKPALVTTALPYANGPIHLGHMVEHIQGDIWVRILRMLGKDVIFICGEDAHGTPIMLSAKKLGITPEEMTKNIRVEHERDFQDFHIDYDNYYTTHSPENKQWSEFIYNALKANGDIEVRDIQQCFDEQAQMFLPDRFVKGECPRCHEKDQYGDNCEKCGATYSPAELINPISVLSGTPPIEKESTHYFFKLENYHQMLEQWIQNGQLQTPVVKKLLEWFEQGLSQWDISRDEPYFGFEIPDAPGKYFYVWLDAPIGYMATFSNLCAKRDNLKFDDYWRSETTELFHFIGKDIIYFHSLFWPAMLTGSGFRKPTAIFAHGFLTVDGQKMSKSRGTFINARDYLDHLDPEYLRYYFAAKLGSGIDDLDLNLDDFVNRVNSDLIGKFVNIASRCAGFITKKFDGMLGSKLSEPELYQTFVQQGELIAEKFIDREYNHAIRDIMALADKANQYIADKAPWALTKEEDKLPEVQTICTMGINLFYCLMIYLKPILPVLATNAEAFLNIDATVWQDAANPLLDHKINKFKPLMQRIEQAQVDALLEKTALCQQ